MSPPRDESEWKTRKKRIDPRLDGSGWKLPRAGARPPTGPFRTEEEATAMLTVADSIEARMKTATARAEKLPQAILSKAFSGELVPTEAELAKAAGRSYETAEELLRRVTAAPAPGRKARAQRKARPS